jgi:hypothetical protein
VVLRAVEVLEDHGWARSVEQKPPGGGRPSTKLYLHPDIRK